MKPYLRGSSTLFRISLHKKIVSFLIMLAAPLSLMVYLLPLHDLSAGAKPISFSVKKETNSVQDEFELKVKTRVSLGSNNPENLKIFWREEGSARVGSSGFASLGLAQNVLPAMKLLSLKDSEYSGYTVKALGAPVGSETELFALFKNPLNPRKCLTVTIDRAGHIILLSDIEFPESVEQVEVLGALDDGVTAAFTFGQSNHFKVVKIDRLGKLQLLSTKVSSFEVLSPILIPFGENSLVSFDKETVRIHAFERLERGEWVLKERVTTPQGLNAPQLAASISFQKSIAIMTHNQDLRSLQVLIFSESNPMYPQVLTLDNDEKWDLLEAFTASKNVILSKKKTQLFAGQVTLLTATEPSVWKVERSFSTEQKLGQIVAINDKIITDANLHPFAHPKNPIRVLHATLEYFQSEVGGIAAVTKTLLPKLNKSQLADAVQAFVIMPKFEFLKFDGLKLEKAATIEHFYKNAWVKSDIWRAPGGLFLVEPSEGKWKAMFLVKDKNSMYNDEEHSLPIERLLYFNSAVAAFVSQFKDPVSHQPFQVLHMHSYHSAVAVELLELYRVQRAQNGIRKPQTILHMHGLSFDQGWIKGSLLVELGLEAKLEWENLTKRVLGAVDTVVTVSQNMYQEGLTDNESKSYGLSHLFRELDNRKKIVPVLNGINSRQWDPTDKQVFVTASGEDFTFDSDNIQAGKDKLKSHLKSLGYFKDDGRPLVTFVGRFSDEKGIEHLQAAVREVINVGGNFAIMGSYSKSYNCREMIETLNTLEKGEMAGRLLILDTIEKQQKNNLGMYVRAASDFSFVPSKEETCGLVPLEFFGFGALTITSHVGGLKDTVIAFEKSKEYFNGFVFDYDDSEQLYWSIREAFSFIREKPESFARIRQQLMKTAPSFDWSTPGGPVSKIVEIYKNAVE